MSNQPEISSATIHNKAFVLRLAERLGDAINENVVGVGWSEARELESTSNWHDFKEKIRKAYPGLYNDNERGLGQAAGSLWRFLKDINVGDLIVVPVDGGFHIATVTGDAYYYAPSASKDFAWRRSVNWLTKSPIPRNHAHNNLQLRLKSRQTCVVATDLISDIKLAYERKEPVEFASTLLESTDVQEAVAKALCAMNDRNLEKIVSQLARADGASTNIPPRQSREPGDVDIVATYDFKIGGGVSSAQIRVAYQVKNHQGTSDEEGIKQLVDRMNNNESFDYGCLVTSAHDINEKAKELVAALNNISVVTQKELVEWILRSGLTVFKQTS